MAHPADRTRATDAGFETGDTIGLFVAAADAPLEIGGNLVNNEPLTLAAGTWTPRRSLYWDDGTYNAYAYYPYTTPVSSIDNMPFSVSRNQGAMATDGMDGYEASDLLYARTSGVSASASPIRLTFRHIMSKITIRLIKARTLRARCPPMPRYTCTTPCQRPPSTWAWGWPPAMYTASAPPSPPSNRAPTPIRPSSCHSASTTALRS